MDGILEKFDGLVTLAINWSPKLILAVALFIGGFWLANKLTALIGAAMERSGLDGDILPFLKSLFSVLIKMLVIFTVAGIVGIETSSFVAALAAVGFAIGMALQGSLGHFAAGIMILIFRPYTKGDFITVGEHKGYVQEIQIINTIIKTLDNEIVIIPNGVAIGDVVINSSGEDGYIRIETLVCIPYDESFPRIKEIAKEALANVANVLPEPAPLIGIEEFDSHSIKIAVKPYAKIEDYEQVYYDTTSSLKAAFSKHNVKVAYSEGVEMGDIGD